MLQNRHFVLSVTLLVASVRTVPAATVPQPHVECWIQVPDPNTHYIDVTLRAPEAADSIDFKMPVWIPGSYLIREFERHVEAFRAEDASGNTLPWKKVTKNTWRVYPRERGAIQVRYRVYAFELNVRTSYVDDERAFINPSSVVMFAEGYLRRPYVVHIEPVDGWTTISTGLDSLSGDPWTRLAHDYDELVDCPILIGRHHRLFFEVSNVPHEIAISGKGPFSADSLLHKVPPIVREALAIFGSFPYRRYVFLVLLSGRGGGGLEHRNSCALQLERFALDPKGGMSGFLSLVAHEFFHAWNVKSIRPAPLGPFDYDRENYTTLLWLAEGFTTYYAGQIKLRVGLTTPEAYLKRLADEIARYEVHPGRKVQSLEMASFDAWIKYYRRDENFVNSGRSYYGDGALFATLLDLEIRHRTGGQKSLDDVMRALYERFAKKNRWVTFEDFVATCSQIANADLHPLFRYVTTTEDMDFARALGHAGLEIREESRDGEQAQAQGYLGATVRPEGPRVIVAEVLRNSPAWRSGLYARDEILAVNGYRVDATNFRRVLERWSPGDTVHILVSRDGLIRTIQVVLGKNPRRRLTLQRQDEPTALQDAVYRGWLHIRD